MTSELLQSIRDVAESKTFPDGSAYASLSLAQTSRLAASYRTSVKKIERIALENDIVPERYSRNIHTLTTEDQVRLLESSVGVVGLGGLAEPWWRRWPVSVSEH